MIHLGEQIYIPSPKLILERFGIDSWELQQQSTTSWDWFMPALNQRVTIPKSQDLPKDKIQFHCSPLPKSSGFYLIREKPELSYTSASFADSEDRRRVD